MKCNTNLFANENDKDAVLQWFSRFGQTDTDYFHAHYERFRKTKKFAIGPASDHMTILDIGAHWLHNAFFYANEGHEVYCVDAPNTMRLPAVMRMAEAMKAQLHVAKHLEFGDGISEIADSSVDIVLFCEIIEHLSFNPLLLWKQIFRVMREGARIIVTTPNAASPERLKRNIARLRKSGEWGPTIDEIFTNGTFGHHWKEFTAAELTEYFLRLSPDFSCNIQQPLSDTIFAEIRLPHKQHGIALSPPWIPLYE
jgi:2-polyprenyl-6-hydroxyphenyl methylase/3-demethylubiquinone-9 3-methyltransferase